VKLLSDTENAKKFRSIIKSIEIGLKLRLRVRQLKLEISHQQVKSGLMECIIY